MAYKNAAKNWLPKFKRNEDGQVMVITALSIIPILTIAGLAIDFQLTTTTKARIQHSLDAALIAGSRAKQAGKTNAEIKVMVSNYLDAMLESGQNNANTTCDPVQITFTEGKEDIQGSIQCVQATTISAAIGRDSLSFSVNSASTYGIGKLDVAFVFDVSGSMGGSKMEDLKDAAEVAVSTLLPESRDPGDTDVRISMASYEAMVNAGAYFQAATGVTKERTYEFKGDTWYREGGKWKYGYKEKSKTVNSSCVYERGGDHAFTDAAPGNNTTHTLKNDAGDDETITADSWLQPGYAYWDDWWGQWETEGLNCNSADILALTNKRQDLLDYVDDLSAGGGTAGHQGIAWGWYLLSPAWSSVWPDDSAPLPYDEPDAAKAMIMMTDGSFNREFTGNIPGLGIFGGFDQGDSFEQAAELCDAIKAQDVVIYTVAFKAPPDSKAALEACSSGPEYSFDPDNSQQLEDAYRSIATSISDLRITS